MSLSVFDEKAFAPNDEMLSVALNEGKYFWDSINKHIISTYKNISAEWKYYSKSAGWTFVIKSGKRTLVYLIPLNDYFKANFVFGEKSVLEVQNADLPEPIVTLILEAKPHMEGRSFMVDVKTDCDINIVIKLLELKNRI